VADLVKRLNTLADLVEGEPGGMDMTMTSGAIFREAATYIEHLLSIISDLETSLPILIEGARRPFREEIERLSALIPADTQPLGDVPRTFTPRDLTDAERQEIRQAFHLD